MLPLVFAQMTVTWTSGYNIDESVPFVQYGMKGEIQLFSPAGTLTFEQNSMCGMNHLLLNSLLDIVKNTARECYFDFFCIP